MQEKKTANFWTVFSKVAGYMILLFEAALLLFYIIIKLP